MTYVKKHFETKECLWIRCRIIKLPKKGSGRQWGIEVRTSFSFSFSSSLWCYLWTSFFHGLYNSAELTSPWARNEEGRSKTGNWGCGALFGLCEMSFFRLSIYLALSLHSCHYYFWSSLFLVIYLLMQLTNRFKFASSKAYKILDNLFDLKKDKKQVSYKFYQNTWSSEHISSVYLRPWKEYKRGLLKLSY
jgi:hypothetical protein